MLATTIIVVLLATTFVVVRSEKLRKRFNENYQRIRDERLAREAASK